MLSPVPQPRCSASNPPCTAASATRRGQLQRRPPVAGRRRHARHGRGQPRRRPDVHDARRRRPPRRGRSAIGIRWRARRARRLRSKRRSEGRSARRKRRLGCWCGCARWEGSRRARRAAQERAQEAGELGEPRCSGERGRSGEEGRAALMKKRVVSSSRGLFIACVELLVKADFFDRVARPSLGLCAHNHHDASARMARLGSQAAESRRDGRHDAHGERRSRAKMSVSWTAASS